MIWIEKFCHSSLGSLGFHQEGVQVRLLEWVWRKGVIELDIAGGRPWGKENFLLDRAGSRLGGGGVGGESGLKMLKRGNEIGI